MSYSYSRAFCRTCRLHFEYALADVDVVDDVVVLCPRCEGPARYRPFQPCDEARYGRIEAQYEGSARHAVARQPGKRSKGQRRLRDDEDAYDWDEEPELVRKRAGRSR